LQESLLLEALLPLLNSLTFSNIRALTLIKQSATLLV
jgi:hypothetical protein